MLDGQKHCTEGSIALALIHACEPDIIMTGMVTGHQISLAHKEIRVNYTKNARK